MNVSCTACGAPCSVFFISSEAMAIQLTSSQLAMRVIAARVPAETVRP